MKNQFWLNDEFLLHEYISKQNVTGASSKCALTHSQPFLLNKAIRFAISDLFNTTLGEVTPDSYLTQHNLPMVKVQVNRKGQSRILYEIVIRLKYINTTNGLLSSYSLHHKNHLHSDLSLTLHKMIRCVY